MRDGAHSLFRIRLAGSQPEEGGRLRQTESKARSFLLNILSLASMSASSSVDLTDAVDGFFAGKRSTASCRAKSLVVVHQRRCLEMCYVFCLGGKGLIPKTVGVRQGHYWQQCIRCTVRQWLQPLTIRSKLSATADLASCRSHPCDKSRSYGVCA